LKNATVTTINSYLRSVLSDIKKSQLHQDEKQKSVFHPAPQWAGKEEKLHKLMKRLIKLHNRRRAAAPVGSLTTGADEDQWLKDTIIMLENLLQDVGLSCPMLKKTKKPEIDPGTSFLYGVYLFNKQQQEKTEALKQEKPDAADLPGCSPGCKQHAKEEKRWRRACKSPRNDDDEFPELNALYEAFKGVAAEISQKINDRCIKVDMENCVKTKYAMKGKIEKGRAGLED